MTPYPARPAANFLKFGKNGNFGENANRMFTKFPVFAKLREKVAKKKTGNLFPPLFFP